MPEWDPDSYGLGRFIYGIPIISLILLSSLFLQFLSLFLSFLLAQYYQIAYILKYYFNYSPCKNKQLCAGAEGMR